MERLRELLSTKMAREKQMTASGTPLPDDESKECWLCAKKTRTRFRFRDGMRVCFQCFRITYLALALPYIDTAERRQSDVDFLRRIAALEKNSDSQKLMTAASSTSHSTFKPESDALFSTVEVADPTQAQFVMDASFMLRHRSKGPAGAPASTATTTSGKSDADVSRPWTCPECTFFNGPDMRECEACSFVNPGTIVCEVCHQRCSIAKSDEKETRCKNGKIHSVWKCGECHHVNTIDSDTCRACRMPRYWACLQCTALHNNKCGDDGLRYCATCGSYNTPEDIVRGQAKIEREHKKAELVAAQQREDSKGDYTMNDNDPNRVEFGVNDSVTLAEVQRQNDIEYNRKRLLSRLGQLNVPRHEQKSDGNCLFAALAHQLFGNARLHTLVRSLVVAYMRANEEDYAVLFESKREWANYVERMTQLGCWGDELCLNAAARCFCVNVHVITSDEKRWHLIFQQDQLGKSNSNLRNALNAQRRALGEDTQLSYTRRNQGKPGSGAPSLGVAGSDAVCLFLAYQAPVHYDDITPSPVKAIVLSDLLQPELHAMLKSQSEAPRSPATSTARVPVTPTATSNGTDVPASYSLPVLARAGSGSYVPLRTPVTSTARPNAVPETEGAHAARTLVAPRSRGPGSAAGISGEAVALPPATSNKRGSQ